MTAMWQTRERVLFADRADAGRRLARRLTHLQGVHVVVLGLPRGGVPVAAEVARELSAPLDVIVVRKLGVPYQPELALGAVGEGDVVVVNDDVVSLSGVRQDDLHRLEQRERAEVERRARLFRAGRIRADLRGRTVVVVDDGIATGATARAACAVARAAGAARVVLAVPVCSRRTAGQLRGEVDELVVLETPPDFVAVGQAYSDFRPVPDEDVTRLLTRAGAAARAQEPARRDADSPLRNEDVEVAAGPVRLAGHLTVPDRPLGVVVFVHGSGSSRHSPRNRFVAQSLQRAGLATLLFDLLAPGEEADRANVFAVELLAERLASAVTWLRGVPECRSLPRGYLGASTGAGAALCAAAMPDDDVAAVVSRGGRPDLAGARLEAVRAPTLLIVGERDDVVVRLNEVAAARLRCPHRLVIVPGATHLFEEPGTLDAAAQLARDWFVTHLSRAARTRAE
jgi:putative phosphoribosyl transferase